MREQPDTVTCVHSDIQARELRIGALQHGTGTKVSLRQFAVYNSPEASDVYSLSSEKKTSSQHFLQNCCKTPSKSCFKYQISHNQFNIYSNESIAQKTLHCIYRLNTVVQKHYPVLWHKSRDDIQGHNIWRQPYQSRPRPEVKRAASTHTWQ